MTLSTSVPQPTFGPTGFIVPADSAILTGVRADVNNAFGGNLNGNLATPQGQLASSETAIISDADAQFLFLTQQFDPALNSGIWQDGIAQIYFLTRLPAASTVVQCLCTGLAGVIIPAGAPVPAEDGNIYYSTSPGTINTGGNVTIPFACGVTGPISCPEGSIGPTPAQAIPGWDSCTNLTDGVLGSNVESPQQFEARRGQSVAVNSFGPSSAIQGNVLQVPGVLDAYTYNNDTAGNITLQGQPIAAKSIFCCVSGGAELAVATAIFQKKAPGCGYVGNTSITVYDTQSGYEPPYPSYTVSFQIPTSLEIFFLVTLNNNAGIPANAAALVQAAIIQAFAGGSPPCPRARIGSTIFASNYYAVVAALGAWAQIVSIVIGSANAVAATFTATIANQTMDVTAVASGNLGIGQYVIGGNVANGAVITGVVGNTTTGVGNYTLSTTQTVGNGTLNTVAANLNDLTVQINQIPVITGAQITVNT